MARDDGGENFSFSAGRVWNFKFRYNKIRTRENGRKTINENEWTLIVWPSLDCKLGRAV
jgi:hypothetical protein